MAETSHPTDGDPIRRAVATALKDLTALNVREDERSIVLRAVLDARLGKLLGNSAPAPLVSQPQTNGRGATPPEPVAEGDVLGAISSALRVDRDTVELVYAAKDGEPQLVVPSKRLQQNKAQAARQLGQLVAAARQVAGLEEWTAAGAIRKVVEDYGKLDSSNFAATIQQMDNVAVIRGKGAQREIKITKPGLENTADLVRSLAGAES